MNSVVDIRQWLRRSRRNAVFVGPRCQTVRAMIYSTPVFFSVANPKDAIQREHVAGRFYEQEELAIIAKHFPIGGSFLDIGANVGNHSLFLLIFAHARLVVPVEPNPVAAELLIANLYLNGVEGRVDFSRIGYGASDVESDHFGARWNARNLGGARLVEGGGDIPVIPAGALLEKEAFDLVKIDVEGMELKVLASLFHGLGETRPKILSR